MSNLKVALIGCGVVAPIHLDALKHNKENVVALCDIIPSKCEEYNTMFGFNAKIYSDYKEMLDKEDIDVVHICTPHYLHAEMTIYALKKNINVLCEKPLAISYKQLDDIKKALDDSKGKLGVCMQRRFEPTSQHIKKIFKDNQVVSANGNLSWKRDKDYYVHDAWRGKKKTEGGGVLINQALHTLDLVSYFMGYPDRVIGHTFNDTLKGVINVEESAFAVFLYNDGRRFLIEASNANNDSHEISIALKNNEHKVYYIGENLLVDNEQVKIKSKISYVGKKEWGYGHFYLISEFYRCIRENCTFPIGYHEGSMVVKMILSIYKSKGKEIKL